MRSVASRIGDALEAPRCSGLGLGLRTVPLVEVALHGLHQVGCGVKVGLAVPWHRCRPHRPTDATDRWASMRFGFLTGTRVTGTISYRPLRRARAGRLVRLGRTRKGLGGLYDDPGAPPMLGAIGDKKFKEDLESIKNLE